jgi:hypothetical protein
VRTRRRAREDVDLDVVQVDERLLQELDALVESKSGVLVARAGDDADDDAVEDRAAREITSTCPIVTGS